ncbi:hypothetical protein C7G41_23085 [Bradyrhizobium sp. MOS002]|jgi:hypothetical protein|nr:hypothetical protein C7G41_23085 [Bradyrhizobium sp. MOS002]
MTEVKSPKTETEVRGLLRRAARLGHNKRDSTPSALETDPNREFARLERDRPAMWFFGTLPIFMILYAICAKIGAL